MWPKRKKKGRGSKAKLKTVKPGSDADELDVDLESEADGPEGEQDNRPDDLFSGVWKSKVLQTYKKNPRDSHTLLAKVPTGAASFETGPREKSELIRESMIGIIDHMFDHFQNTAYEFNRVTGGSDLELSWIRPCLTRERVSEWHSSQLETADLFSGRISTRYWSLVVRGSVLGITAFILPADKMLAFNSDPGQFKTYLRLVPSSDGFRVDWFVGNQDIHPELMPRVYGALLDGLVRFANEEASGDDCFMLSDIGIVPAATALAPVPEHLKDDGSTPLQGQQFIGEPAPAPAFPGVIDKLSSRVATEAQAETDRVRQTMKAETKESTSSVVSRALSSEFSTNADDYRPADIFGADEPAPFQGTAAQKMTGEWKTISTAIPNQSSDWRKFMAASQSAAQKSTGIGAKSSQEVPWQAMESGQNLSETNLPSGGTRGPQDEHQSRQFSSRNVVSAQMSSQPAAQPQAFHDSSTSDVFRSDSQQLPHVPLPPPPGVLETVDRDSFGLTQLPPGSLQSSEPRKIPPLQAPAPFQVPPIAPLNPPLNQSQQMPAPQPAQAPQPMQLPPLSQSQVMKAPPPMQLPPMHQSQVMPAPQPMQIPPMHQSQVMQAPQPMQQPPQQMPPNGHAPHGFAQSGPHQMPPPQVPPPNSPFAQQQNYGLGFPPQNGYAPQPIYPPGYGQPPQSQGQMPPGMLPGQMPQGQMPQSQVPPGQMPGQFPPGFSQGYPQTPQGQYPQAPGYPPGYPIPPGYGAPPQDAQPQNQLPTPGAPGDNFDQTGHQDSTESEAEPAEQPYPEPDFQGDVQSYDEEDEAQQYNYDQAPPEEPAYTVESATDSSGFPGESHFDLPPQVIPQGAPVSSTASYAQLGTALPDDVHLAADPDLADALTVLLATIDKQIEALTRQGAEAFSRRDFRQAESIVRLSERLTNFKSEALLLLEAIPEES